MFLAVIFCHWRCRCPRASHHLVVTRSCDSLPVPHIHIHIQHVFWSTSPDHYSRSYSREPDRHSSGVSGGAGLLLSDNSPSPSSSSSSSSSPYSFSSSSIALLHNFRKDGERYYEGEVSPLLTIKAHKNGPLWLKKQLLLTHLGASGGLWGQAEAISWADFDLSWPPLPTQSNLYGPKWLIQVSNQSGGTIWGSFQGSLGELRSQI